MVESKNITLALNKHKLWTNGKYKKPWNHHFNWKGHRRCSEEPPWNLNLPPKHWSQLVDNIWQYPWPVSLSCRKHRKKYGNKNVWGNSRLAKWKHGAIPPLPIRKMWWSLLLSLVVGVDGCGWLAVGRWLLVGRCWLLVVVCCCNFKQFHSTMMHCLMSIIDTHMEMTFR